MTLTVFTLVMIAACVLVMKYLRQFLEFRRTYNKLPGDEDEHWLMGNLHKLSLKEEGRQLDYQYAKEFKYFHRLWLGPFLAAVAVYHPVPIRQVVKSSALKPRNTRPFTSGYDMGAPWLGEGLILTNGDRWARHRRLLTRAFHLDILQTYVSVFNCCSSVLQRKILEVSEGGKSFDLQPLMSLFTLDVILRCAFSYRSNCQMEANGYAKTISELQRRWAQRTLNPLMYPEFLYRLTPGARRFHQLCHVAHREAEVVIASRRQELADNPEVADTRKARDFLDILLTARDEDGNGLSWLDIRDEVDTFMFAGHDTTASGLMWTLVCLSQHTVCQERVHEEIVSVLGDREDVLWEDLNQLQYTTQCIKEALRLHTTVPIIERLASEDIVVNQHRIPAGTRVILHLWMLHHNPHLWQEPHLYRPDRFHPHQAARMDPFQFMPFSAGTRNCIGKRFAMNEMKVALVKIIRRFQLRPDPARPPKPEIRVTMKATGGAYVYATPRPRLQC